MTLRHLLNEMSVAVRSSVRTCVPFSDGWIQTSRYASERIHRRSREVQVPRKVYGDSF